jgi:uncharacterized protein
LRIAVVGGGITGLAAAWLLSSRHEVVLFEEQTRLGGHSNTVDVATPGGDSVPIDTGFIVYNEPSYPNLTALFDHLGVATAASTMSFAVSLDAGGYEYSGTGLRGLFGQLSNIASPSHWRMTADILRFHREAQALAITEVAVEKTLGAWLTDRAFSQIFINRHILPMAAAIWSAPAAAILEFPVVSFARFFANHGLLTARNQPVWRTVVGGSRCYVDIIRAAFRGEVRTGDGVVAILRDRTQARSGVQLTTRSGAIERFDRVAVCCHADDALAMLADPTAAETAALGRFAYVDNTAVLHTDARWMPRRRRVWSSWNYMSHDRVTPVTVTYWMNSLQPLNAVQNYFVTLNPVTAIDPAHHIRSFAYRHPMFDQRALRAQAAIWELQGRKATWFGGSYCGYGFHEDGLQAGLAIAEDMTRDNGPVRRPWTVADESGRLTLPPRATRADRVPILVHS